MAGYESQGEKGILCQFPRQLRLFLCPLEWLFYLRLFKRNSRQGFENDVRITIHLIRKFDTDDPIAKTVKICRRISAVGKYEI